MHRRLTHQNSKPQPLGGNPGEELKEDKWKGEDALRCEVDTYTFIQTIWLEVMTMGQVHNSAENWRSWEIDKWSRISVHAMQPNRESVQKPFFFFFFCIAMRCLRTLKHKVCLQEYQTLLMFQTN